MKRAPLDIVLIALIAKNVTLLRKAAGWSQEELAHRAGLDRTYISQVERKKRNLTISVLSRLARALNTAPNKLLLPISRDSQRQKRGKPS
jgi:transcriptional regulator with XRE-family HTH domain